MLHCAEDHDEDVAERENDRDAVEEQFVAEDGEFVVVVSLSHAEMESEIEPFDGEQA